MKRNIIILAAVFSCGAVLAGCTMFRGTETASTPEPVYTAVPTATPEPAPTPTPTPEPTATPEPTPEPPAPEFTGTAAVADSRGFDPVWLLDGDPGTYAFYGEGDSVWIENEEPIQALYLTWYREPEPYTVTVNGESFAAGENGFIFEYVTLPSPAERVELTFSGPARLSDIRAFGGGTLPRDIQVWETPCEQADVLVFPTHADDDVIFFGALMVSCVERGLNVQVCYMCNHYDDWYEWRTRPQELLCCLWEMGIRHYPVIGPFPDHYVLNLEEARAKFGEDNVIAWQVEQIRRFRPLVVLGHDREGEYGHGAHRLNSLALEQAVPLAADGAWYPESAERWGTWDAPKLYLHFAEENPIAVEVETPLADFGWRTAFEVARDAMLFHESQLQYDHRPTLDDPRFPRYDCRRFGLVRSLVGEDAGDDIMENTESVR